MEPAVAAVGRGSRLLGQRSADRLGGAGSPAVVAYDAAAENGQRIPWEDDMEPLIKTQFCRRAARACLEEAKRSPPSECADLIRISDQWLKMARQGTLRDPSRPENSAVYASPADLASHAGS